ncbi:glycosyltransferase [filamentous cyanobacterium LEGE 11480]|uniref:Glycosyltransferase n=1 Tax=Romeriopsis navalis LEGE 11480 TaxID=2777977 RepID=A0A928Z2H1_9CYAN|nr:glycosyltransferase [Romeriopsis navalis]MBE9029539.1 glycosyltransferase [Romeriopsis navalis LEGE 11480]
MHQLKIFMPCTGLGRVNRGYESFTRQCFDRLSAHPSLSMRLYKGAGQSNAQEKCIWHLPRDTWLGVQASRVIGRLTGHGGPYFTEQLSFFVGLLPYIYRHEPDVIYFSDESLGDLLWHWRNYTNASYKLLFSNGGPTDRLYNLSRWDYVHQVASIHYQKALDNGLMADRQIVLPYGAPMPPELDYLQPESQQSLRANLGLPMRRKILLSVASIDKSHKRLDYLIREVAQLPAPRPYVLMLGHQGNESAEIIQLAQAQLGDANFQIRTVPADQISDYYKVADLFVLPSLREGLPRVLLEASSYGLPCLVHDYQVTHDALGEYGHYADFSQLHGLQELIAQLLPVQDTLDQKQQRHQYAYQKFSWDVLTDQYVDMFEQCLSLPVLSDAVHSLQDMPEA